MFIACLCSLIFVGLSYMKIYSYWLGIIFLTLYIIYLTIVVWKDRRIREGENGSEGIESDAMISPLYCDLQTPIEGNANLNHLDNYGNTSNFAVSPDFSNRAELAHRARFNSGGQSSILKSEDEKSSDKNRKNSIGVNSNFGGSEMLQRAQGEGRINSLIDPVSAIESQGSHHQKRQSLQITNSIGGKTSHIPEENVDLSIISLQSSTN